MYDAFYGFREKPFSLLPDPDYLYLSPQHEKALGLLELSLHNQAGFCVVSGEIGAGKTTLIRKLLTLTGAEFRVGLVSNTLGSFGDLMNWILMAFKLPGGGSSVERHERFIDFIIQQYGRGRRTVLIIDEAQNLGVDALEELRMLSNVNADKHQVLQVILVGQAGLRETLRRPELAQFAQRVLMDFHLGPLGREDSIRYIRHRILVAGADPQLFSEEAAAAVFRYSGGVPRIINLLCDTALVYGYAEGSPTIGAELIHAVVRERQSSSVSPALRLAAVAPAARPVEQSPVVPSDSPTQERREAPPPVLAEAMEPGLPSLEVGVPEGKGPEMAEAEDDGEWLRRLADSAVPPALRNAEPKSRVSPAMAAPAVALDPPPATITRPVQPASVTRNRRGARAAAVLLALLVAGAAAWWYFSVEEAETALVPGGAAAGMPAEAARQPPAPPTPAIAHPEMEGAGSRAEGAVEPRPVPEDIAPSGVPPAPAAPLLQQETVTPPSPVVVVEPPVLTREPEVVQPAPLRSAPVARGTPPAVEPAPILPTPEPAVEPVSEPARAAVAAPQTVLEAAPATPAPEVNTLAEAEPAVATETEPVPVASEPQAFTTDPCRGPAARYLSTCR